MIKEIIISIDNKLHVYEVLGLRQCVHKPTGYKYFAFRIVHNGSFLVVAISITKFLGTMTHKGTTYSSPHSHIAQFILRGKMNKVICFSVVND